MVQLAALGIQPPQINALGAFQQGAASALGMQQAQQNMKQSAETHQSNMQNAELSRQNMKREQALKTMEIIGSVAMGAMDGKIDGQVDPNKYEQGLNMLESYGVDVSQFRGKPELAPIVAKSSLSAMQQLQVAQNDRQYELALKKFELDVTKAAASVEGGSKGSLGSPVWGQDEQGNAIAMQVTESGQLRQLETPEGAKLSTGVDKIDLGTQWGIMDKRSGQIVGYQPKDVAGEKAQEAIGKAQGEARATLPSDIQSSEQTIKQIDDLLTNPGFNDIFGAIDQFRPGWTMPAEGRDALARYNQLKGKAFLEAYGMLKGGGQITEVEGQKAQDAMARLDRAQSEETAKQALMDFKDAVKSGVDKLKQKAGVSGGQPQHGGQPPEITTEQEYNALPSGAQFIWKGKVGVKP